MINIWIGCDEQFQDNFAVQINSISNHVKEFNIRFLKLDSLKNILTRERSPFQSTDSAFTRWLVPYLSDFKGWHLYMDSDMMVRRDLEELWQLRDSNKAVMVVKHPKYSVDLKKFNNQPQTDYDKKNWSSLMLFNSERCKALHPNYINSANGLDLHQFKWTDEDMIGELPSEWNHLVGVNAPNPNAAVVHWTLGGPWFNEFKNCEFYQEWNSCNSLK